MIELVKENKEELVKKVSPNMIYNRMDIMYDGDFELLKAVEDDKDHYISFHVDGDTIYLGVYLTPIKKETFDEIIKFLRKHFRGVDYINIRHSLNGYKKMNGGNHWTIQLPQKEEDYIESLGTKTRQHIKQYFRRIDRDFEVEFKTFEGIIPDEIVYEYFRFKHETIGHTYRVPAQEYLRSYRVTKAHVLYLNKKIAAISFICEVPDSGDVYYENFSYDNTYSKYSLGIVSCYYTIKKLIEEGKKNFYLAGGDYLYKRTMSNKLDHSYSGNIYIGYSLGGLFRALFSIRENDDFIIMRIFGIKIKKRKMIKSCPIKITRDTKCLMVAPHPDDEMLGAGEFLIKYADTFDCICLGASGVAHGDGTLEAKERLQLRLKEFNQVMDRLGIKNRWIFETYGVPRFDRQMDAHFDEYCEVLDTKKYDYIFLPHPKDGHHEHRYITNKLFKKILKKKGYKEDCKIIFYEVWDDIKNPNLFFDTSDKGVMFIKNGERNAVQEPVSKMFEASEKSLLEMKYEILDLYKSQWVYTPKFGVYNMKKFKEGKSQVWNYKYMPINKYV